MRFVNFILYGKMFRDICWYLNPQFSSFQSLSCVRLFATPWTAAHQASLSITNSQSLLKLTSIMSVMLSNHIILCLPLSSHLQSFPASESSPISQFFTSGGQSIGVFSFSVSPSNAYSGLISFRIDWFDVLAIQRTHKSLLKPHFKSINSLVFSFLYSPTVSSLHDYWEKHSFD